MSPKNIRRKKKTISSPIKIENGLEQTKIEKDLQQL